MSYWNKRYAIEKKFNEKYDYPKCGGIYLWKRTDGELTYFYVGQAMNLHKRMLDYYMIKCGVAYPKRHFEASLKNHKDWKLEFLAVVNEPTEERLNELESKYLKEYLAKPNYITRNSTGISDGISLTDKRVLSNKNRAENIAKKERETYKKLFSNLKIVCADSDCGDKMITIQTFQTKKGKPTIKSLENIKKLIELIKEK